MSLPPVTLDEIRDMLDQSESDGHSKDGDMWDAVLSATELVEDKCGPIRPRVVSSRIRPDGCTLFIPTSPILSVTSVTDYESTVLDVDSLDLDVDLASLETESGFPSRSYTVVYVAGRDPIPQGLMDAVLIVAKLHFTSRRGGSRARSATGDAGPSGGGLDWYRAQQLMEPHLQVRLP